MREPIKYNVKVERVTNLNNKQVYSGPVIYWMSRDQRVSDNWALLYAAQIAKEYSQKLMVVFALTPNFPNANMRHYKFIIEGLFEVEEKLRRHGIPFQIIIGNPPQKIKELIIEEKAGAVVTEFDPLRIKREWKSNVANSITIPLFEVDAHNIVPCKLVSNKIEFGAYTLRPKLKKLLPEFLEVYPELPVFETTGPLPANNKSEIIKFLNSKTNTQLTDIEWIKPGEKEALNTLRNFINFKLKKYPEKRNDPNENVLSNLSPYLHFGNISSQSIALELAQHTIMDPSTGIFLDELIVRKELSDNFCYFNKEYDSFEGFHAWAKTTLNSHRDDKREFIYSDEQLESAKTHDRLWNAAQKEMVIKGKMHGYMRMYWAKKILEWTETPEIALKNAIYLNDKYQLDGRDPNGYTGCAWSIGGVHDRAWSERAVFGKIRYMNYNGCKRKFNIEMYINNINSLQ